MTSKERKLKKRLDAIDEELQSLHARVAMRRPLNPSDEKSHENITSSSVAGNPYKNKNSVVINAPEDCKGFLRSISRSIAKGSDAIQKIASLTDFSRDSVPGSGDCVTNAAVLCKKNGVMAKKKSSRRSEKSVFVSNKASIEQPDLVGYGVLEREFEKLVKQLRTSRSKMELAELLPTKDTDENSETEKFQRIMDENVLTLAILTNKLDQVKKKLNTEKTKRENAERAVVGCRKRLIALEKQNSGKDQKCERFGEENSEKAIKELQKTLEVNRMEIAKLEESKSCALEMMEKFREKVCQHDPKEIEKLRTEKDNLEKQLFQLQERHKTDPILIEGLIERAERAEKDLIEKMKQCNDLMSRSSINDPDVQTLLARYKSAYKELEHEKIFNETTYAKEYSQLNKELDEIRANSEKKYKGLNRKYKNNLKELKGKELALESLLAGKNVFEKEISSLKARLLDASQKNENQEAIINSLKEKYKTAKQKLEKLQIEYEEHKKTVNDSLNAKMEELKGIILYKEKEIETVRKELEESKDTIKIKEKMLDDQSNTIKCLRSISENTKKTLDDEREQKKRHLIEFEKLKQTNQILEKQLSSIEKKLAEGEKTIVSLEKKKNESLMDIELQVCSRQKGMEKQLSEMKYEKDQAIQSARFATEKLVLAINDYEAKLSVQKRLHLLLTEELREKEYELEIANNQLSEINDELWRSARNADRKKKELEENLRKACEVCADVIQAQMQKAL